MYKEPTLCQRGLKMAANCQKQGATISNGQVIKEYKVLSQKDKWYSGKFDPDMLEKALNDYARMGYQVICSSTATIQGFTGAREEMIIILERDKQ